MHTCARTHTHTRARPHTRECSRTARRDQGRRRGRGGGAAARARRRRRAAAGGRERARPHSPRVSGASLVCDWCASARLRIRVASVRCVRSGLSVRHRSACACACACVRVCVCGAFECACVRSVRAHAAAPSLPHDLPRVGHGDAAAARVRLALDPRHRGAALACDAHEVCLRGRAARATRRRRRRGGLGALRRVVGQAHVAALCAHACARVCVCACAWACAWVSACLRVHASATAAAHASARALPRGGAPASRLPPCPPSGSVCRPGRP